MNSTSKDFANLDKPWGLNQQSVANGLGVNGSIIGIQNTNTEGGAGIMLSKMISQLSTIQQTVAWVLEKVYTLHLRLGGFNPQLVDVKFKTSTISDELKLQQGQEIKIRNLNALYDQGIIDQDEYARLMGYDQPSQQEPRVSRDKNDIQDPVAKKKEEDGKDKNDRTSRDKSKPIPKRKDQDGRPR